MYDIIHMLHTNIIHIIHILCHIQRPLHTNIIHIIHILYHIQRPTYHTCIILYTTSDMYNIILRNVQRACDM